MTGYFQKPVKDKEFKTMRCPTLKELPPPPQGKTGWPWTEETPQLPETGFDGWPWPKISIVTASYKRVQFIEETIRSILLQGYPDLEYIIIDGASDDGTAGIIKKYEPWIAYWVSEKDRGENHALNKGLPRCSGEIITFFSSDDIYLKGTFADVGSRWSQLKQYGAVVGGFYFMDINSQPTSEIIPPRLPHPGPIDLTLIPPEQWRLHQEATFYTRQALDSVGRYVREDLLYTADRELLYRLCRNYRILLVQRAYSAFRVHEKSCSMSKAGHASAVFEYAKLHLSYCSRGDKDDARRRRTAKYQIARAYLTYAKCSGKTSDAVIALLKAVFYRPALIVKVTYFTAWLKVLRLVPILARLGKRKQVSGKFGDSVRLKAAGEVEEIGLGKQ